VYSIGDTLYQNMWGFPMKNVFLRLTVSLMVAAALSSAVFAWDETGHKLSAYIAWQTMSQTARDQAIKILLAAPEDSDLSVTYSAFSSRSKAARDLELFMYAAGWPDVVRNRDFEVRYKKYHHSNWHYADIFWKENGEILKDFPEPSGVALAKLTELEKMLQDPTAADSDKAVALAWFLHVAADLHNPLHNASRVTDTEPKGDQGGNLFYLEPEKPKGESRLNLHWFWDSIFTKMIPRQNDAWDDQYVGMIGGLVTTKYPLSEFGRSLGLSNYQEWNTEAFTLLPEFVYGSGLTRDERPSADYARHTLELSEKQIALAGYRIGETFNKALGGNAGTASAAASEARAYAAVNHIEDMRLN
jgi:hypothetical protein